LPVPVSLTWIDPEQVFDGTTTVSSVPEAFTVDAVADAPQKLTVLFAAVVLKLIPLMVTVIPGSTVVGVNESMAGPEVLTNQALF
jgi:hypothetical protein